MKIDGKERVKERIKVFENDKYITYLYIFENGNSYRDTVDKWKQKDFGYRTIYNVEDRLMEKYIKDKMKEV